MKRGFTLFTISLALTGVLLASGQGLRTGAARADSAELWAKLQAQAETLPAEIVDAANRGEAKIGQLLSDKIFDQLGSQDLFSVPFKEGGGFSVHVGRSVYSNHDIEESFTVVDRMGLPISLPGLTVPLATPWATFNVGLGGSLDFMDLRVIRPSDSFYKDPMLEQILSGEDLEARRAAVEESDWLQMAQEQLKDDGKGYLEGPIDETRPVLLLDSLRNARWGRVWNLVAAPLRLPLKAEWLSHLAREEMISYAGSGTIEVGPSIGITSSLGVGKSLNLGGSVRAYLRGEFRISILKVEEKRARVKVSREVSRGVRGNVGLSTSGTFFEGFVLTGNIGGHQLHKDFLKIDQSLIPISFGVDTSLGHSFEIGYEFDLADERAIEAYEQAVTGRLALSDTIIAEAELAGAASPVRRTFRREADEKQDSKRIGMNLRFIQRQGDGTYSVQDAVIELPDGTSHVVKARTDVIFQNKASFLLWTSKESVNYSIRTDFIENLRDPSQDALYGWIAEMQIQDSDSSGFELNRYSEMVQSLVTDKKVFPTVPVMVSTGARYDIEAGAVQTEELTAYGQSSFYLRIGLSSDQLLRLSLISKEKMWDYLEAGFERPRGSWTTGWMRPFVEIGGWAYNLASWLFSANNIDQRLGARFYHAKDFQVAWLEAQAIAQNASARMTNAQREAFAKAIGRMYSDRTFAYEIIKTTMIALRDQGETSISFQVNAQTAAFPGLDLKGGKITEIEKAAENYAKITDWDQHVSRQDMSLEASAVKAKVIDGNRVEIRFTLSRAPTHVILKLDKLSKILHLSETRRRLLVKNNGQFPAGEVVLLLDRQGPPGYATDLANALIQNTNYRLTLALMDGDAVGPAASVEFFMNPLLAESSAPDSMP